jgi:aryl-alcohol dehydrogenase-like predicted oxidoreductase
MSNKLILGTVQFGIPYGINNQLGQTPLEEVHEILDFAYEHGIVFLDTAAAYGISEKIIGDYLSNNPDRNFKIITKFDLKKHGNLRESFLSSLQNLKQEHIDTIMYHSFNDYKNSAPQLIKFEKEFKDRKYSNFGVSVYSNRELEEVIDLGFFDIVQLPFNLLDNEYQRGDLLKKVKKKGIEIHTRSVFLQGLFFMDIEKIPVSLSELLPSLKVIHEICQTENMDIAELSLMYPLSKKYIDAVLLGVDSVNHLRKNINSLGHNLATDLQSRIDDIKIENPNLLNPSLWKI